MSKGFTAADFVAITHKLRPLERRYKLLAMSGQLVLEAILFGTRREGSRVRCVRVEGVPDDARVEGVAFDDYRDCFVFRLYHPSFDVVPDCEQIPCVLASCFMEYLDVAPPVVPDHFATESQR